MDENRTAVNGPMVKAAARMLGSLAARGGDSYDVLEGFSAGWAEQLATGELSDARAAYTGSSQTSSDGVASVGPNSSVDQDPPAPVSREQLRLQLAVLADLRAAVESVIEWRVQDAREQHWSWAEIAEPLEITKQGAHKRYDIDRVRVSGAPKV